jgi:hypothetical protein
VAALRENPNTNCTPFGADTLGRVILGCWDSSPDGGPAALVAEPGGRIDQYLASNWHMEQFAAYPGPHGVVAVWDRPDAGDGAIALANEQRWQYTASDHLGLGYAFEGGLLVGHTTPNSHTWQRFDDLGTALTPAQTVPSVLQTHGFWAQPDSRGNVLAAWQPVAGGEFQAQWYSSDFSPVGSAFPLTTTAFPFLQPLPGGGFAASPSDAAPEPWLFIVRPGESKALPVPPLLSSRGDRAFWTVFSGDAYAFIDTACGGSAWPCPTAGAEIAAADGTSCGMLRLRWADGSTEPFTLTNAGTIIDGVQEKIPDPSPPGGTLRVTRWWPGVLRRP